MKDPIVAIALAGTSRQEHVTFTTGTPVDALIAQLPEGDIERAFLLGAGAWAIYRQAGTQAMQPGEAPTPAADETLRECSPGAALLVSRLLSGEQAALLPDVLERLRQQKLRLPFRLLPSALNRTSKVTRDALFPLLGERGRWLSQFNPSWKWVNEYLVTDETGLPVDAETIWQEGTSSQRFEILSRLRAVEPDKARAWLMAVWKQEKAETRHDFLTTLRIGLSMDDEPFLEQAFADRAGSVRAIAALLLGVLPTSTVGERMRQRGRSILQMINGRIRVEPPDAWEPEWQNDGLVEMPPQNFSQRGWWLIQILAAIEPTFWETHLGASPAALLELFSPDDMWRDQVIEGWSQAARKFRTVNWLEPLCSWWIEHQQKVVKQQQLIYYGYGEEFLQLMPGSLGESIVLRLLEEEASRDTFSWWRLLANLPTPWSTEFARVCMRFFRKSCTLEKMQAETFNSQGNSWLTHVSTTALALPTSCLAEASQSWELPKSSNWQVQYATRQIKEFIEIVHLRQKIYEEIG